MEKIKDRVRKLVSIFIMGSGIIFMLMLESLACNIAIQEGTATIGLNKDIVVPINLTPGTGEHVAAMQSTVSYDPGRLTLSRVVIGSAASEVGKEIAYAEVGSGQVRIIIYGVDNNSQNLMREGIVCELTFGLAANAQAGEVPLFLSEVVACDENAAAVPVITADSQILIGIQDVSLDLSGLKVYPNPFKPSKGHSQIIFMNLTQDIKIDIYTISGELVREIKEQFGGMSSWDGNNDRGEPVASGVYIYRVSNNAGNEKKGRLVIIK